MTFEQSDANRDGSAHCGSRRDPEDTQTFLSFARVHREHRGAVHGVALRICGARLAGDVTQEVFLRLWTHPEKFDPERGSLRCFLLMMSRHKAVDAIRAESVRRARALRTAASSEPTTAGADEGVLHTELAARVAAGLDQLHPNQKEAIELAFYGGLSYREVAVILGRAEGTIKGRIRKGLQKLQIVLADLVAEPSRRATANAAPADSALDSTVLILAVAQIESEAELHERELREAFDARLALEQAKGIISERDDITIREAFSRLQALAQRDRRSLIDTASAVVEAATAAADRDHLDVDLTNEAAEAATPSSG